MLKQTMLASFIRLTGLLKSQMKSTSPHQILMTSMQGWPIASCIRRLGRSDIYLGEGFRSNSSIPRLLQIVPSYKRPPVNMADLRASVADSVAGYESRHYAHHKFKESLLTVSANRATSAQTQDTKPWRQSLRLDDKGNIFVLTEVNPGMSRSNLSQFTEDCIAAALNGGLTAEKAKEKSTDLLSGLADSRWKIGIPDGVIAAYEKQYERNKAANRQKVISEYVEGFNNDPHGPLSPQAKDTECSRLSEILSDSNSQLRDETKRTITDIYNIRESMRSASISQLKIWQANLSQVDKATAFYLSVQKATDSLLESSIRLHVGEEQLFKARLQYLDAESKADKSLPRKNVKRSKRTIAKDEAPYYDLQRFLAESTGWDETDRSYKEIGGQWGLTDIISRTQTADAELTRPGVTDDAPPGGSLSRFEEVSQ